MARYPSALLTRAIVALLLVQLAAACGEASGTPAGNTELNVVIPNNAGQSSNPAAFDIEVVEYTIACNDGNTPGPFLDNNATFEDDLTISGALEVLDTASSGVSIQDFGPDLAEVYVWQGFMDLPPTSGCTVQLRARDADGEVICTATESFDVTADTTTKVNVLMYCGISFQAPVGMLDLDGDFSFNVANFCPDLFVLNCIDSDIDIRTIPGIGEVAATACQVRFRDGDSSCGGTGIAPGDPDGASSCDPQDCAVTPEGLDCAPNPAAVDPVVTTTVTCSGGASVIDCTGTGTPAASCVFTGDTTGNIGDPAPGPLAPGEGGFFVACALFDDDGDPSTPDIPVTPGATVTCTAVTTDGDTDCDKVKTVDVTCPGIPPCQIFGGDAACEAASSTVCQVGACNDATCDGASAPACCDFANAPDGLDCSSEILDPVGECQGGVCTSTSCTDDASCDTDGNDCTFAPAGTCNLAIGLCGPLANQPSGFPCDGGTGACDGGGTCISQPVAARVETYNLALAGAFIPYEQERRVALPQAIASAQSDILCLQEVWDQADKDAIAAAALGNFPYIIAFVNDLDTALDDATDQNGVVPPAPTTVPCPDDVEAQPGITIADQMNIAIDCVRDGQDPQGNFCSTIPGSDQGRTTSTDCAAQACLFEVADLVFGTAQQQRCYACLATQLPTDTFGTIRGRCPTIVNQELAFQGQNGVMILSRYPLKNAVNWVIPGTWNRRVVLSATAELPNGSDFDVFCNHLTPIFSGITFPYTGQYGAGQGGANGWEAEQFLQAEKLIAHVQDVSGSNPAVILGDLNAGRGYFDDLSNPIFPEGEATLNLLEGTFTPAYATNYTPACTFCQENPVAGVERFETVWIDHIQMYNLPASAVTATERTFDQNVLTVPDGNGGTMDIPLSDHYGMRSVIAVP